MKVKYVGKLEFIAEFNGKKYCFSRKNPVMEMPIEAFAYIVSHAGFASDQIVPCIEDTTELNTKIKELEEANKKLVAENKSLEKKLKAKETKKKKTPKEENKE